MSAGSNKKSDWGSFEAESEGGPTNKRCRIARLMEELPIEGRIALTSALANKELSGAGITRALIARGYTLSRWTVGYHRNRQCSCPKT